MDVRKIAFSTGFILLMSVNLLANDDELLDPSFPILNHRKLLLVEQPDQFKTHTYTTVVGGVTHVQMEDIPAHRPGTFSSVVRASRGGDRSFVPGYRYQHEVGAHHPHSLVGLSAKKSLEKIKTLLEGQPLDKEELQKSMRTLGQVPEMTALIFEHLPIKLHQRLYELNDEHIKMMEDNFWKSHVWSIGHLDHSQSAAQSPEDQMKEEFKFIKAHGIPNIGILESTHSKLPKQLPWDLLSGSQVTSILHMHPDVELDAKALKNLPHLSSLQISGGATTEFRHNKKHGHDLDINEQTVMCDSVYFQLPLCQSMTKKAVKRIAELKGLIELSLRCCNLTLDQVESLQSNSTIKDLDLSYNNIHDEAFWLGLLQKRIDVNLRGNPDADKIMEKVSGSKEKNVEPDGSDGEKEKEKGNSSSGGK